MNIGTFKFNLERGRGISMHILSGGLSTDTGLRRQMACTSLHGSPLTTQTFPVRKFVQVGKPPDFFACSRMASISSASGDGPSPSSPSLD